MKYKLIIVGSISETLVAKFRTFTEANQCGSLLEAMSENPDLMYYIECNNRRTPVDSFTTRVGFLNSKTREALKNYFKEC